MNHSSLVLAYLGDSVFELKIREHFVNSELVKVNDIHKKSSAYASAKGHSEIVDYLTENNLLNDEEIVVYKRGRNAKVNQRRKNFHSKNYHASTGFEALIGYLHLKKDDKRIDELIELIIERFEK